MSAALFEEFRSKGVKILQEPQNHQWAYEMKFEDQDGNVLWVALKPDEIFQFSRMDKPRLTEIFNRGFRQGANDRANRGLPLARATEPPSQIPDCRESHGDLSGQIAWNMGYATGYQIGASDTELASVDGPAAHGMLFEMNEEMLEKVGAFKKMSDES